jgi:hypothetical protein
MMRVQRPLLVTLLGVALHALTANAAYAHHLELTAASVCVQDTTAITFTIFSGSPLAEGSHNNVVLSFNGINQATYQLTVPNGNTVSGTLAVPGASGGDSVVVSILASGPWVDGADGGQSDAETVVLSSDCDPVTPGVGRFTGGGKSIDTGTGLKVTKGFTIHCDLLLSNNLEINWPGTNGRTNQFHMTQHTSASCTDDPAIDQRPPAAPVDRIDGVGTGKYNGVAGATVEFTLVDAGEPGTADQIGFLVRDAGGNVVLNLPLQNIVGGNVQAHYDQPHKNK